MHRKRAINTCKITGNSEVISFPTGVKDRSRRSGKAYTAVIGKRVRDFDRKQIRKLSKLKQYTEKFPGEEEYVKVSLTNVRDGSIIRVFFLNKNV